MSDRYRDRDDEDADLELEEAEPPRRRGRLLAIMIALFAIGGFGGVLWYAYSQGQRNPDAVAPVLKADGEPSRMKPDQPGGMVVPHQDKLVLNNMQQASRPAAEKLLPPAETPLPQTARTAPPPAALVAIAPPPSAPPPAAPATPTPIPPPPPAVIPTPPPPAAASPAIVPPNPPPSAPPPSAPTTTGSLVAPPAPPPVAPAPSGTSSSMSAPPTPPPPSAPPPQMAARPPSPPPATSAATPRSGGGSEWRVQLGSFPAADQATAQWDRLKKAHAELQMLGLTTVRVDLGDKGVWYRLQAGPLGEPQARALCEDLKSKKRDCLVVRP